MDSRERAALGLFVCRVTTLIIAYVFALRATDATAFSALLTEFTLMALVTFRAPVNFNKLRSPWASRLVAYLDLCEPSKRLKFESVLRGWERQGCLFLLAVSYLTYWNMETYTGFVFTVAITHGIVLALLLLRVRYALRSTCD